MEFNATFIVSAVSFIVFVFIMNIIFYKPIQKIVNEREGIVESNWSDARKMNEETERIYQDKETKIVSATKEARDIVSAKTLEAQQQKEEFTSNTISEYSMVLNTARQNLSAQKESAKNDLKGHVNSIASMIVSKLMNDNVAIDTYDEEIVNKHM